MVSPSISDWWEKRREASASLTESCLTLQPLGSIYSSLVWMVLMVLMSGLMFVLLPPSSRSVSSTAAKSLVLLLTLQQKNDLSLLHQLSFTPRVTSMSYLLVVEMGSSASIGIFWPVLSTNWQYLLYSGLTMDKNMREYMFCLNGTGYPSLWPGLSSAESVPLL